MGLINNFIDFILHLDKYLSIVIQNYGATTYFILFLIVFAETGFVVTPFLPGDSLLFAAGTFAAMGALNLFWAFAVLGAAAILGDSINYSIGKFLGKKVLERHNGFIKKEHIEKTRKFYEKYGAKTIVLARFVPIVRTFAPFVAGIGRMNYFKFLLYNVVGGILWVALFVFGGYYFGNIPVIKRNFTIVIFIIIIASVIPIIWEYWKHKRMKNKKPL